MRKTGSGKGIDFSQVTQRENVLNPTSSSLKFFPPEENMDLGVCYVRFEVRLEKRIHTVQGLRKEVRKMNQTWERVWAEPQRRKESAMPPG